jgi:hypothetical protein
MAARVLGDQPPDRVLLSHLLRNSAPGSSIGSEGQCLDFANATIAERTLMRRHGGFRKPDSVRHLIRNRMRNLILLMRSRGGARQSKLCCCSSSSGFALSVIGNCTDGTSARCVWQRRSRCSQLANGR